MDIRFSLGTSDVGASPGCAVRTKSARHRRLSHVAAWAFMWVPLSAVVLFYLGDAWSALRPLLSPLLVVLVLCSPVLLVAATVVVIRSQKRIKWLFAALNGCALILMLVSAVFAISFSGIYR